eukprot:1193237-Prorocentrum_minimum.AAC.3
MTRTCTHRQHPTARTNHHPTTHSDVSVTRLMPLHIRNTNAYTESNLLERRRGPRKGWSTGHNAPRWAAGRTGPPRPACVSGRPPPASARRRELYCK